MKNILAIIVICLVSVINSKSSDLGVNLSALVQPTKLNDEIAIISGGRVALTYDNTYAFGLILYSNTLLKHNITGYDGYLEEHPIFEINYYGVDLEYFIFPEDEYHFSFGAMIGNSDINFTLSPNNENNTEDYKPEYKNGATNLVFVPRINLNLNFKHFYRLAVGLSYRFFPNFEYNSQELINKSDNSAYVMKASDINGLAINFAIKFGSF